MALYKSYLLITYLLTYLLTYLKDETSADSDISVKLQLLINITNRLFM